MRVIIAGSQEVIDYDVVFNAFNASGFVAIWEGAMNTLYLIRGLPGSGKSELAESYYHIGLVDFWYEADMFFVDKDGEYVWESEKISEAHQWCRSMTESRMREGYDIVVSNTFTTEKELAPYYELAYTYNYKVVCVVVENRHKGVNVHSVPDQTLLKMKNRFSIKLTD